MIPPETFIKQLFNLNDDISISKIIDWIGYSEMREGDDHTLYEYRIKFLVSVWNNPIFRPFDTARTAENYLNLDRKYGFIIRLSSEPGKITLTHKIGKIYHSRFNLCEDGKLNDSKGNSFDNIDKLANHVATLLSGYSRRCEPVPNFEKEK